MNFLSSLGIDKLSDYSIPNLLTQSNSASTQQDSNESLNLKGGATKRKRTVEYNDTPINDELYDELVNQYTVSDTRSNTTKKRQTKKQRHKSQSNTQKPKRKSRRNKLQSKSQSQSQSQSKTRRNIKRLKGRKTKKTRK